LHVRSCEHRQISPVQLQQWLGKRSRENRDVHERV